MTSTLLQKKIQQQAYRLLILQGIILLLLAVFMLLLRGLMSGYSFLLGGLAYILPNFVFVWRVFRFASARQASQFMAAFFVGEMFKLLLSAVLFVLIVQHLPVSLLSVLAGYISAIVAFWIACIKQFS